jgi:dihydroflavonol-4-reductase
LHQCLQRFAGGRCDGREQQLKVNDPVLVTGATGLLGAHLVHQLLQSGRPVFALRRETSSLDLFNRVGGLYNSTTAPDWLLGALDDDEALLEAAKGVKTLFHCAGLVSFFREDRDALYKTNVLGTARLVNVLLSLPEPPALIHVSSIASLGRSSDGAWISEKSEWTDSPLNTHYAITKHLGEMEVWRGFEEGLHGAILNPGIILGTGDGQSGSNVFFREVKRGLKYHPQGGNGFVSVEDCVRLLLLLESSNVQHRRFIAVSENLSYKDLLTLIATAMGKNPPSRALTGLSYRSIRFLARMLEPLLGKKLPLSYENLRVSGHTSLYDNRAARSLGFDFEPIRVSVERTAAQLAALSH